MQEATRRENTKQIIGEFLAICPIFVVSYFIGLLPQALLSAVLVFAFKQFYADGFHAPKGKEYVCILITYFTMTLALTVAYFFKNEYFTQVIFIGVVCFISSCYGEKQKGSDKFDIIHEPYNMLRQEKLNSVENKETEFYNLCRNAKLGERDTKLAFMRFYENKSPKEIWLWLCDQKHYDQIEWDSLYVTLNRIAKKLK